MYEEHIEQNGNPESESWAVVLTEKKNSHLKHAKQQEPSETVSHPHSYALSNLSV